MTEDRAELIRYWRTFPAPSNEVAAAEIIEQLERELAGAKHDLERSMANHNADLNAVRPYIVAPEDRLIALAAELANENESLRGALRSLLNEKGSVQYPAQHERVVAARKVLEVVAVSLSDVTNEMRQAAWTKFTSADVPYSAIYAVMDKARLSDVAAQSDPDNPRRLIPSVIEHLRKNPKDADAWEVRELCERVQEAAHSKDVASDNGWRPVEELIREDGDILAYSRGGNQALLPAIHVKRLREDAKRNQEDCYYTHWQPLLAGPGDGANRG